MSYAVDIFVEGKRMGGAYLTEGRLSETVGRASTSTVPVVSPRDCEHTKVAQGFAYIDLRRIYWPVEACRDCRTILKGRSPYPEPPDRRPWEFTEEDVIASRWSRQWPKYGRPRAKRPPKGTEWPEAA